MRGHYVIDSESWEAVETYRAEFTPNTRGSVNYYYTNALAALNQQKIEAAKQALNKLMMTPESVERNIQMDQIKAIMLIEEGLENEGIELLKKTAETESALPIDFGPPVIVKPSYELLGDILLEMGKADEAREAYKKQLERTPERRRSLLGMNE